MSTPTIIRPGDSLDFSFSLSEDESTDGWTCQIILKKYPSDTALVDRTISLSTDNTWDGYLTSTETASLDIGNQYNLLGLLENTSTDESREIPKRFYVGTMWAA